MTLTPALPPTAAPTHPPPSNHWSCQSPPPLLLPLLPLLPLLGLPDMHTAAIPCMDRYAAPPSLPTPGGHGEAPCDTRRTESREMNPPLVLLLLLPFPLSRSSTASQPSPPCTCAGTGRASSKRPRGRMPRMSDPAAEGKEEGRRRGGGGGGGGEEEEGQRW